MCRVIAYFLSVLRDRVRSKSIVKVKQREKSPPKKPVGKPVSTPPAEPAPSAKDLALSEGHVREEIKLHIDEYQAQGLDWVAIYCKIDQEMKSVVNYFGFTEEQVKKRHDWLYDEVNYWIGKSEDSAQKEDTE